MTQYNILKVRLSNSQLNKLKYWIKNSTEITLELSSNVVDDSNDDNNFSHKLLLQPILAKIATQFQIFEKNYNVPEYFKS